MLCSNKVSFQVPYDMSSRFAYSGTYLHELYVNSSFIFGYPPCANATLIYMTSPITFPISDLYFIFLLILIAITEVKTSKRNYFLHHLFGPYSLWTVLYSLTSTCLQSPSAVRVYKISWICLIWPVTSVLIYSMLTVSTFD